MAPPPCRLASLESGDYKKQKIQNRYVECPEVMEPVVEPSVLRLDSMLLVDDYRLMLSVIRKVGFIAICTSGSSQ